MPILQSGQRSFFLLCVLGRLGFAQSFAKLVFVKLCAKLQSLAKDKYINYLIKLTV